MLFTYLRRGLVAGAVGGTIYGLFTLTVVSNLVSLSESFASGHHAGHEPVVPETMTIIVSVSGGILWGIFLGLLAFGAVYYFLEPALPGTDESRSYLLAGAGFIIVSGAPWLVLPPLPPGVDQGLPTETRILWYVTMMVIGAIACGTAGYLYNRLRSRWRRSAAIIVAGTPVLLIIGVAIAAPANPASGDVPARFVATYQWIIAFGQAGLWFTFATVHVWLLRRNELPREPETASAEITGLPDT